MSIASARARTNAICASSRSASGSSPGRVRHQNFTRWSFDAVAEDVADGVEREVPDGARALGANGLAGPTQLTNL